MKNFHIKQPCILDKPLTPALQNWQTYFQHFNGIVDDQKNKFAYPRRVTKQIAKVYKISQQTLFQLPFVICSFAKSTYFVKI